MRLSHVRRVCLSTLAALAAAFAAGCGNDDPAKPTGPVTVTFRTPIYQYEAGGPLDTVFGELTIDPGTAGAQTIRIPTDSLKDVARGQHVFEYRLDADYLPVRASYLVDPNGTVDRPFVDLGGSCRDIAIDGDYCLASRSTIRSFVGWSGHARLLCATNDFGESCTRLASPQRVGLTWPGDVSLNEYVSQAKLLVGARVGAPLPSAGNVMAMSLHTPGDYSPRSLLRPVSSTDSTRMLNEAWSDARHLPLFLSQGSPFPVLFPDDRPNDRFGLSVKITYFVPTAYQDAIFARYDVTNISNTEEYRFRHPAEPEGGHTITDVYLAPTVDADIGGTSAEVADDNATVFPNDSLLVAYDQDFDVPGFLIPASAGQPQNNFYVTNPGLVGLQLIAGPPGTTARGFLFARVDSLTFIPAAREARSYQILSAGRAGVASGCQDRTVALVCTGETATDVRMGWSVGPIGSLAPGEATSITVAILVANPHAGAFTSGTAVAPGNDVLGTTDSPLRPIAADLLALAAQTKTVQVPAYP